MTQKIKNFSLLGAVTTGLTATDTSQRVSLNAKLDDVMVINDGSATVYVRTGDSSVVADTNAMPILPGEKGVYAKGNTLGKTTSLAYFVPTGSASFKIIQGNGS